MKNILTRKAPVLLTLCFLWCLQTADAQERIKILSYNVLNYPSPDFPDFRADTLKQIFTYYKPDLFLMQELKAASALTDFTETAFNESETDNYLPATWLPQQSAPWSSWKLQQNVIYNADKLTLLSETFVQTNVRDHNVFRFMVNDPNIESHNDTTVIYAVSIHLKSSQGSSNEQSRLAMSETLIDYFETLEVGAAIVLGGDFNIYTANEPAYQHLLAAYDNGLQLHDPLDAYGSWHNSSSFSDVHTQSTRTSQLNGDGAGGGMDDRFDFVLLSDPLMDSDHRVHYVPGSYENIGNSGNCFNGSIMDCTNGEVSSAVRSALFQMSDHLPVKLEIDVEFPFSTHSDDHLAEGTGYKGANAVRERLELTLPNSARPGSAYRVYNTLGNPVTGGTLTDASRLTVDVSALPAGWYLLHVPDLRLKPFRFLKM